MRLGIDHLEAYSLTVHVSCAAFAVTRFAGSWRPFTTVPRVRGLTRGNTPVSPPGIPARLVRGGSAMLQPTTGLDERPSRSFTYPLRQKWVGDAIACIVRLGLVSGQHRLQHHIPTSHEVGMKRQTRSVVGSNIKTHLSRGGYARKSDTHPTERGSAECADQRASPTGAGDVTRNRLSEPVHRPGRGKIVRSCGHRHPCGTRNHYPRDRLPAHF